MTDKKDRILICGLTNVTGGMEVFVRNLYRHIDKDQFQFDFINHNPGKDYPFADEILQQGGRIINLPKMKDGALEHYRSLYRIFRSTRYKALYFHANRHVKNADLFRAAKAAGVPIRILHCHVAAQKKPTSVIKIRERLAEKTLDRCVTDRFACSEPAGNWMFGEKPYVILNNGIETQQFDYDPQIRERLRNEMHAGSATVYGSAARLSNTKNPLFLVDVFQYIHQMQPDSMFWLVGDGSLFSAVREKARALNLEDSFFLFGYRDNVSAFLNAMDVFLLPSIHEALSISLVEAQTSGLKCLASDAVPRVVNLTGNVTYLPLGDGAELWAKKAVELSSYERMSCRKEIIDKQYDIEATARTFEHFIRTHG